MNTQTIDPMTDTTLMTDLRPDGNTSMLIYESLARERRLEAERVANHARLVRRLSSARRWQRLSAWTARRAKHANDLL
jgi:hypothetical protein